VILTFYKDLKRVGIQKTKKFEGIDFHALRATFATSLARADVPLTQTQRLMRHSDPKLTANVYTDLRRDPVNDCAKTLELVV